MFVRSWLDLKSRMTPVPTRRQRQGLRSRSTRPHPLRMEPLEDRRLLAFDLAVNYPAGENPQAIVTADFNGDTRLDLAIANHGSSNVSVLLGNADGTFRAAQDSPTGAGPTSIAVGDFNSDGKVDLATANYGGNNVSVLLGNGAGGFAAPLNVVLTSGHTPLSVAVGDFNADGRMDLAVGAKSSYFVPPWSGDPYYGGGGGGYYVDRPHLSVLMGSGDGRFGTQNSYDLGGTSTTDVAVGDFNGDGKADVAAAAQYVHVLLGNGDGTLQSPKHFGSYGSSIAIADTDRDGKLDLITPSSVALGDGLGAFRTPQYFASGANPTCVATADFNGDGKVDLVVSDLASSAVNVLLGAASAGSVAFKPPVNAAVGARPVAVVVGDFNGDGRFDVASANGANNVSVLLNNGSWPALDAPSITINDVTVTEGNTGTVSADFTVSLSAAYGQTVTVQYVTKDGTAAAGSDYQAASGTLTFAPGVTSQRLSIPIYGDRLGENYSEWFSVNLNDPTNAFVADATGGGTILEDEPYLSIDYYERAEGNTGVTPFIFTVTLSAPYDVPVTVDYATADLPEEWIWYGYPSATAGVDYTSISGTLTIPAGQTTGTIGVSVTGDRLSESHEYFLVNLSNAGGAQLSSSQGWGAILDDEPYVSISGASALEGDSGTSPMTFTVSLSAAYDADVTVSYATVDGSALGGSDYKATTGTITIPAGQTTQTFTVPVNGDLLVETDEYFWANLTSATNAVIANAWGYATILDDDTPPTISISDAWVAEGNSGTRLMSFTVSLSNASGEGVSVNYKTVNGSATTSNNDYVAKSGTVYFAPGETSKTVTVSIKGDTKKEKDEQFYVNLSGAVGGAITDAQGIGTILNDDGGTKASNRISYALAVDSAIEEMMSDRRKKRDR